MENEAINKIKKIGKISPTDYIYMSVVFFVIIIITIIFLHSTGFIVENINKIFSTREEGTAQALDMTRYSLIEKKLNLPKNNQINPVLDVKAEQTIKKEEVVVVESINKKDIKINIINAARKEGVASALSKKLEASGFTKAITDSKKTISPSTTIEIKTIKKEYKDSIINIVKKSYPKAIVKINPENSDYDVIITIGK